MVKCAGESPFTLELDPLPQYTAVKRDVFSIWYAIGVHLVRCCCLAPGGLMEIIAEGGVRLASFDEGKAAEEV